MSVSYSMSRVGIETVYMAHRLLVHVPVFADISSITGGNSSWTISSISAKTNYHMVNLRMISINIGII
jgi:hypothetical protein